jgi:hypothetical protein
MGLFRKAIKQESKLRLAIMGPSGSGKTYSALAIGTALAGDKPVAVLDTENGSASKYSDIFSFDVAEMHAPFHPDKFIKAIQEATEAGYGVLIIDSLSHAWSGTGGVLDLVDEAAKRSKSGNTYMAWKEGTPIHNKLIDAIVQSGIHIIVTMRSKTEYVLVANDRGKQEPKKVGMAPVQRDNTEYEFDVVFDMDIENNAIVSKSRCPALTGRVIGKPGAQVAKVLADWLSGEPAQKPATPPQQAATVVEQPAATTTTQEAVANPFENEKPQGDQPATDELEIINAWRGPLDAQIWAVKMGACQNEHHARESWVNSVKALGGYSDKNKAAVMLHFLRHQHEKLSTAEPMKQAA